MAKETQQRIVYRDSEDFAGFEVGSTTTFVKNSEGVKFGVRYEFPRIRFSDLTPKAQAFMSSFYSDNEQADKHLQFGPRNSLANSAAAGLRQRLVAPSVNSIKKQLREQIVDMLGQDPPDVEGATALTRALQIAADDKQVQELWVEHLKVGDDPEPAEQE